MIAMKVIIVLANVTLSPIALDFSSSVNARICKVLGFLYLKPNYNFKVFWNLKKLQWNIWGERSISSLKLIA